MAITDISPSHSEGDFSEYHAITQEIEGPNATTLDDGHTGGDVGAAVDAVDPYPQIQLANSGEQGQKTSDEVGRELSDGVVASHIPVQHPVEEPEKPADSGVHAESTDPPGHNYIDLLDLGEDTKVGGPASETALVLVSNAPETVSAGDAGKPLEDEDFSRYQVHQTLNNVEPSRKLTRSEQWTEFVKKIDEPLNKATLWITGKAARYPKTTISVVTFISLFVVVVGYFTNFNINVDQDQLWTPTGSQASIDYNWVMHEAPFEPEPRWFIMFFHDHGRDVLGMNQVKRMFQALDGVRGVEGYDELCVQANYTNDQGVQTCRVDGPTNFWNDTTAIFEAQVHSDEDAIVQMSAKLTPALFPVEKAEYIYFADPVRNATGILTSAIGYSIYIHIPHVDLAPEIEQKMLDVVMALEEEWKNDPNSTIYVTFAAERSFQDEFTRAILVDIPLVPIVFVMMSGFTAFVFWKNNRVESRSFLGICAVVTCILSMAFSYGICFIFGVPVTSITQMLPFILISIGLDDSFITMGSYARTDPRKDPVERMDEAMGECGLSITLTSITSAVAFFLDCFTSSVPAVFWVSLYAFPSIVATYLFQMTFFVSCVILDERRVQARRMDCCSCIIVPAEVPKATEDSGDETTTDEAADDSRVTADGSPSAAFKTDQRMVKVGKLILRPWSKVFFFIGFAVLAVCCAISTSKLRQSFKFKDVLPSDSYVTEFINARQDYSSRSHILNAIYFRNEDQADPYVQQQMFDFVDHVSKMDVVTGYPDFFWLYDLKRFVENQTLYDYDFYTQLDLFLSYEPIRKVYGSEIIRDENGKIIMTRCYFDMGKLNADDIKQQINVLLQQRSITEHAPINQGKKEFSFFTYSRAYNVFEFYNTAVRQLIITSVVGVASVTLITLICTPHWTAAFYTLPMMCVLYIDMMGVMQWCGVAINPVSYVALALSIGLLVDYVMHIIWTFYELSGNRYEKSLEMLRTMGSSVFLGGATTFLGTVPLIFSTSDIFYSVFIVFMALVTLGISHALVFMPVFFSTFGTEDIVFGPVATEDPLGKKDAETASDGHEETSSHRSKKEAELECCDETSSHRSAKKEAELEWPEGRADI